MAWTQGEETGMGSILGVQGRKDAQNWRGPTCISVSTTKCQIPAPERRLSSQMGSRVPVG